MTDTDLMPFGKYKGTAMANVPAGYLLWAHRTWQDTPHTHEIKKYIWDNLDGLQKEFKEKQDAKERKEP